MAWTPASRNGNPLLNSSASVGGNDPVLFGHRVGDLAIGQAERRFQPVTLETDRWFERERPGAVLVGAGGFGGVWFVYVVRPIFVALLAVCSTVAAMVSVNDFAVRPARALADEVVDEAPRANLRAVVVEHDRLVLRSLVLLRRTELLDRLVLGVLAAIVACMAVGCASPTAPCRRPTRSR